MPSRSSSVIATVMSQPKSVHFGFAVAMSKPVSIWHLPTLVPCGDGDEGESYTVLQSLNIRTVIPPTIYDR